MSASGIGLSVLGRVFLGFEGLGFRGFLIPQYPTFKLFGGSCDLVVT